MTETWQRAGFGLYVHWPFCAAKCPYCDFNSHVTATVDQARWRDALLRDLAHWAARTPGRVLSTVFFGGGTPSLMPPETVAALLDAARGHWTLANDLEVTLEANPTSVEAARFRDFVGAGVNRFSVGLQALDDRDLRALGRLHSAAEGRRAFEIAAALVDRVSFDLIYARQDQDAAAWRRELGQALGFAGEHLSLYQLTIEADTAFGDRLARGRLPGLPGEELGVALYEVTRDLTEAAGLVRYEVSNHARRGAEARHNLIYWRGGDWVGIGPGAHGRLTFDGVRIATEAERMPGAWLTASDRDGSGTSAESTLDGEAVRDEYLMMSLRLAEGADLDRIPAERVPTAAVDRLVGDDLLRRAGQRLMATPRGLLLLNTVLAELLS